MNTKKVDVLLIWKLALVPLIMRRLLNILVLNTDKQNVPFELQHHSELTISYIDL